MTGLVSLPRDTPGFLNREPQLAKIEKLFGTGNRLVSLNGAAGMGKTCLAIHYGHHLAGQVPVLYAELRGSEKDGRTPVSDVLFRFLRQLGKDSRDISADPLDRVADFRAHTYDRPVLVILDDVSTAAEVEQLTPTSPVSNMIVTSRKFLGGLAGAGFKSIEVGGFTSDLITELLHQFVDQAVLAAEPEAVARLAEGCAGLPLAGRMLGARLAGPSRRQLAWFADQFAKAPFDTMRMPDEEQRVEQAFDVLYSELNSQAKNGYRLFGEHGGQHFDIGTAAALLGMSAENALEPLAELVEAYLVRLIEPDRYGFHPLIRTHACMKAEELSAQARTVAARRQIGYRRERAAALAEVVAHRWSVAVAPVAAAYTGPDAVARAHAELELDEPVYRAAVTTAVDLGLDEDCVAIVEALKPWYYNTDRLEHLLDMLEIAVPTAGRLDDPLILMRMHNDLGSACEGAGDSRRALAEFEQSRRFAEQAGVHPLGLASAVEGIGLASRGLGEHERAVSCFREARRILAASDEDKEGHRERALILVRLHLGTELGLLGQFDDGEDDLRDVADRFEERGELVNQARALVALAHRHERAEADALQSRAGELFAAAGFRSKQAETVAARARLALADDDRDGACDLMRTALTLFEQSRQRRRARETTAWLAANGCA